MPDLRVSRVFSTTRKAGLGDCDPRRRMRLDAIARAVGDIAQDDVDDAGFTSESDGVWVVRRTRIEIAEWPCLGEEMVVATWATGAGGSIAERATSLTIANGGPVLVQTLALWVCLDHATGRPRRLSDSFWEAYGDGAGATRPNPRLTHPDPSSDPALAVLRRAWPVRYSDLDAVGHVNNAVYFAAIEDLYPDGGPPRLIEIEYRGGLDGRSPVTIEVADEMVWFIQSQAVAASARVGRSPA